MKYFDYDNNRLVFEGDFPDPNYWDKGWSSFNLKSMVENSKNERFVSKTTSRYIKPNKNKKILEGGCGLGNFVYSLKYKGYDAYGIDFASKTVARVNKIFPDLKISVGDVFNLSFPDNYFDGYWSLGVIEHFYDGYSGIVKEMSRVVKKDGFVFITFPHISILRKLKAKLSLYPQFNSRIFEKKFFYQFALDAGSVIDAFEKENFVLIKKRPITGLKGMKDEVKFINGPLRYLCEGKSLPFRALSYLVSSLLSPFSGHAVLLIFKNNKPLKK